MKKTLADFAEFVKQIELDDDGLPTNLEARKVNLVWERVYSTVYICYDMFYNENVRITPKPKMRAMDFRDADKLIGQVATYCNNGITLYYVIINGCFNDKISADSTTYAYDDFHELYTRPDGSKFEVEDV